MNSEPGFHSGQRASNKVLYCTGCQGMLGGGARVTQKLRYDQKKDTSVVVSSKKQKVPVKKRYLEDADISAY